MSEPRFLYEMSRGIIRDNGRELFPHKAVQLLNALYNENRTLKGRLQEYEEILLADNITDLETQIAQLKKSIQDYEDTLHNWFIENWHSLSDEQKQSAHLELGIDLDSGDYE